MPDQETLDNRVYDLAKTCAAILQGQQDLHNRLFVDGGGALPLLYKKIEEVDAKVDTKADVGAVADLSARITKLKEKSIWQHGLVAGYGGAGAALVALLKLLAAKLGWIH